MEQECYGKLRPARKGNNGLVDISDELILFGAMKRDLKAMGGKTYDVLVVGCGVYGAFAAREAALRGLSVAVIDRKDFCSSTSANSLKIIHGGLRYLQKLDICRVLESAKERKALMRIAPHLVHPLPCAMPTRGYFTRSRPVMAAGMLLNDLLTCGRNKDADPAKHIPSGRIASKDEFRQMVPCLDDERFDGAAVWHDALCFNTERLVVSAVKAAVKAGADAANYAEMIRFTRVDRKVTGAVVKDAFSGAEVTIKAGVVINNTGPWSNETLAMLGEPVTMPVTGLALELNFVLKRRLLDRHAVGLSGYRKSDARERLLFFVPWRGRTMAGTYCRLHAGPAGRMQVLDQDISTFLEDLNSAFPAAKLTKDDIALVHAGLLPIEEGSEWWPEPEPLRHYKLIDHGKKDGVDGLFSVLGVKYTTARGVAEKTIDKVLRRLGRFDGTVSKSSTLPLPGGDTGDFNSFLIQAKSAAPKGMADDSFTSMLYSYGTEYAGILDLGKDNASLLKPVSASSGVTGAEILYAVRNEMAQTLADVVLRRTDLGVTGVPDEETLKACAALMARELSWDKARVEKEIKQIADSR